jgi:hypothetical protein
MAQVLHGVVSTASTTPLTISGAHQIEELVFVISGLTVETVSVTAGVHLTVVTGAIRPIDVNTYLARDMYLLNLPELKQ